MTSYVIGLDIEDTHVTACLVRIEQSKDQILCIEKDKLFSLFYDEPTSEDPRSIIAIWINCIDELLHDFMNEFKNDDTIIGIACSVPRPMDYERDISDI